MDVEVIPDHYITGLERRGELGDYIGIEGLAIDGTVDHPGGHQLIAAQPGNKGLGVPLAKGHVGKQPLALAAAPPERGHVGLDAGLVDEHQPSGGRSDGRQAVVLPFIALSLDVSAFFLRRQQRFFYR